LSGRPTRRVNRSGGSAVFRAIGFLFALAGLVAAHGASVFAGAAPRKLPMRFTWYVCEPNCGRWIGAVGTVTEDTLKSFDDFAGSRDLGDVAIVLDSSGGSVNDAIALGTKWRQIGVRTTVGSVTAMGGRLGVEPQAWCESMCVFLLLSGKVRYVPQEAHVRVHQIWMGNRTENPKVGTYSAQDMMIIERDIGRLAKYTFEMGGTGELMSLSLDVPSWEALHELSPQELHLTGLVTTDAIADVLPEAGAPGPAVASLKPKSAQDRLVSRTHDGGIPTALRSTRRAEAAMSIDAVSAEPQAAK
jgi:hypothetical protein